MDTASFSHGAKELTEALVAGVGGCPGGWLYVTAHSDGPHLVQFSTGVATSFGQLIEATSNCIFVSVDMPIGLSGNGLRLADTEARHMIGPRRSSVFPPPPRAVLQAEGGYQALNALARDIRAGLSRQTYNLLAKIREVDAVMTPALQGRVRESHPEVSFCALKGACLLQAKRTLAGRQERLALLTRVFGPSVRAWRPPRGAAMDDLYDAAVLAWTAARVARNDAQTLPAAPEQDARGLHMEIVY